VINKIQKLNLTIREKTPGKRMFIFTLIVLLCLFILLPIFNFDTNNIVLRTLRALYHFGGTLAVSFFLKKLRKTHMANNFIWIGFAIWSIVQILAGSDTSILKRLMINSPSNKEWYHEGTVADFTSLGKVYRMPIDNMLCLVPDAAKTARMPVKKTRMPEPMPNAFSRGRRF
jgi:hypothetical protein